MARLIWHGHSTFTLETDAGHRIMFDPFLDDNPKSDLKRSDVAQLDYILCSHGHFDHFGDAVPLAKQTGATVIATFELCAFAASQGVSDTHGMNIGGGHEFPFGYLKLTPALHSGTVAGDEQGRYTSTPCGFWVDLGRDRRLYHAGDTALISDFALLRGQVDLALLPIGDNYTMGPVDAARAVEMIQPRVVIPMHYDTWDLIAQDPAAFRERVGAAAQVVILEPGASHDF